MSAPQFPSVRFGDKDAAESQWRDAAQDGETPDDDDQLAKTPDDVVDMLGFDPLEEEA